MFKTQVALENWKSKYKYKDESPIETFKRVAKAIASVEKDPSEWEEKFLHTLLNYDNIKNLPTGLKCTPGGRITANIGTDYKKATLLNCFVNGPVSDATISYKRRTDNGQFEFPVVIKSDKTPDNLINIFLTILEQAKTLASEGGYGINFSFIRPRGSIIKGVGIRHPGVVSYMHIWDAVSECIVRGDNDGYQDKIKNYLNENQATELKQAVKAMARKGAMLAALDVGHADIEEFIRAKQTSGKLTKFNISVAIDDKFMQCVLKDDYYDLGFNGIVTKRVKARDLYDLMMESTYNRAEPGVLFIDNMHKNNPIAYLGKANATNPCFIGSTLITTDKGIIRIQDLCGAKEYPKILTYNEKEDKLEYDEIIKCIKTKEDAKDIVCLQTYVGITISTYLTQDHKVYTKNRGYVEAINLKENDILLTENLKEAKFYNISEGFSEDVFDITTKRNHNFFANGILFHNCGEVPGLASTSTTCLLGSVNLTQYVSLDRKFNFEQYKEDIMVFVRMLDNVNDITTATLPSYEWATKNLRQFGMGIHGLGSTLIMLGIPYNSKDAIEFTKKVTEIKENLTWQASALLAKEKGTFPAYDKEKFENTEYFKSDRLWSDTKEMIKAYGVRNAKTTTNPPLGNTATTTDNASNGIEPVFDLEYERKAICSQWPDGLTLENVKKILKEKKEKDFTYWRGNYDGREYYFEPQNRGLCEISLIRDYGYQWVLDNFPDKNHDKYLVTTKNLEVKDHIAIQAIAQYYCNQSISKTCNIPEKYPFKDFKDLYIEAWKKGLNGFTTYRDGSMESVLSSIEKAEKKKEIIKKDIKLPSTLLNGPDTIIKREGMKFYIHFSYLPDDKAMKYPIVIWIYTNSKGETVACNRAAKELYKLAIDCGIPVKYVDETMDKAKQDLAHNRLGRMISLCLRHNVPREDIYSSLFNIEGDNISSLLASVRKFIASTIDDGTKLKIKCECGSTNVIFQSNCLKCRDCESSKCP